MPVEIFTKAQFEAALPAGKWSSAGVVGGENCYLVRLTPGPTAVFVRSSVHGDTSAECGEDSIRAWIVGADGQPLGGKSQRWVARTRNWRQHLGAMILKLDNQRRWMVGCPHCGIMLLPFTVKAKGNENKGRAFVACKNPQCPGLRPGANFGHFAFCESEDGEMLAPPEPALQQVAPKCPECDAIMIRMSSGKGWKCSKSGRWLSEERRFAGCNGSIFDGGAPSKADSYPQPARKVNAALAEAKAIQAWHARNPDPEQELLPDDEGRYHPEQVSPLDFNESLREAITLIESGDTDDALTILRGLLS